MTDKLELLIVEDNVAEAIWAQAEAAKVGLRNFLVAQDLDQALTYLEKEPKYLVSDLFFPAGNINVQPYIERFLPIYEAFQNRRFKEIKEESPVYRAVSVCAEVFGVTPEEYVEKVMAKLNTHQVILKSARDAVHKRQDYERFEKFQEVMNNVRNGTKLPLGISLTEKAKEKGIPNIIVTSTYHHSDEFEAVRELVPHYYDQVIGEGDQKRKNWEAGIEHVLRLERNK